MSKKQQPHEISLDILMIRDQQYFKRHPNHNNYIREYVPGEFGFPPHITLFNKEGKALNYTLVKQIEPGLRMRQPLFGELNEILSNMEVKS